MFFACWDWSLGQPLATLFTGHFWSGNSYNFPWQVFSGAISTRIWENRLKNKGNLLCTESVYEITRNAKWDEQFQSTNFILFFSFREKTCWCIERTLLQVYQKNNESSKWKYLAKGNRGIKQILTLNRKPCIIYKHREPQIWT
jgi:hypothetical protein